MPSTQKALALTIVTAQLVIIRAELDTLWEMHSESFNQMSEVDRETDVGTARMQALDADAGCLEALEEASNRLRKLRNSSGLWNTSAVNEVVAGSIYIH